MNGLDNKVDLTMPDLTPEQRKTLTRWRLVLGKDADAHGIQLEAGDEQAARIEALVGYLFEGADGNAKPKSGDRTGGTGPGHAMNVPRWVDELASYFRARHAR